MHKVTNLTNSAFDIHTSGGIVVLAAKQSSELSLDDAVASVLSKSPMLKIESIGESTDKIDGRTKEGRAMLKARREISETKGQVQ